MYTTQRGFLFAKKFIMSEIIDSIPSGHWIGNSIEFYAHSAPPVS